MDANPVAVGDEVVMRGDTAGRPRLTVTDIFTIHPSPVPWAMLVTDDEMAGRPAETGGAS